MDRDSAGVGPAECWQIAPMFEREIYLDNNATTMPLLEVREGMLRVLGNGFGNPSSAHSGGQHQRLAKARDYTEQFQQQGKE